MTAGSNSRLFAESWQGFFGNLQSRMVLLGLPTRGAPPATGNPDADEHRTRKKAVGTRCRGKALLESRLF